MRYRPTSMMAESEDSGECSLNDIANVEPLGRFTSVKELCIFVLKSNGLLTRVWTGNDSASLEDPDVYDANVSQLCKVCGLSENPLKMLVCDLCEEAFHLSCCKPTVTKLPVDEWYCKPCITRKRKTLGKKNIGEPSTIIGEMSEYKKQSSIAFMLKEAQPFTSKVRIGEDFQAAVPDWSGPIYDEYRCAGELMDPAIFANQDCNKPFKPSYMGNWLQCREVINEADGIICGRWRRAPFYVVQTDDWDCYSCVLWDPLHSDCAVPQELETEVILKQIKYIEMLRKRFSDKKE